MATAGFERGLMLRSPARFQDTARKLVELYKETVASGAYVRAVSALDSRVEVVQEPAPLLVPLAEEGWTEGAVPEEVVRKYLEALAPRDVDTIVLGCTHFPVLRDVVQLAVGPEVTVVDSAQTTAAAVQARLQQTALERTDGAGGRLCLLATDDAERFARVGAQFLATELRAADVELVDL